MQKRHTSPWLSSPVSILLSALIASLLSTALVLIFTLVTLLFLTDLRLSPLFSAAACSIGCYAGSYTGGRYHRRKGLINGILTGLTMYCILAVPALAAGTLPGIKKLLLLTLSGAAGGVSGVNSKRPKHYYSDAQ